MGLAVASDGRFAGNRGGMRGGRVSGGKEMEEMSEMKKPVSEKRRKIEQGRRYMHRIMEARRRVVELTERIEECQRMIQTASGILAHKMPANAGKERLEGGVMTLVRMMERLGEELEGYEARVREAEWAIDQMEDPLDRTLLRYHYLCGKTQEQMAEDLHYCDGRYIRTLLDKALVRLPVRGWERDVQGM